MTDILEPSRKVKTLRTRIFMEKYRNDMRLVNDALRQIQIECVSLEILVSNVMSENNRLIHEANKGKEDIEVPF